MYTRAGQVVTPHQWLLHSYLELGALPTAVPCARLHARHLLWEWGLNDLAADIELLVSELVTNAVKATAGQQQAAIRLQLSSDRGHVLVEVWDADPQPPAPKALGNDGSPDPQEEGGRGLFLVAALSARWDWYPTEEPAGKVVWCSSTEHRTARTLRGSPIHSAGVLPRRVPREQQKQPIEVMRDPDVLRCLRGRLRDLSLAGIRSVVTPEAWRELAGRPRAGGRAVGTAEWQVRRVLCISSRYSHGMTSGVSPLLPPDQYIASLARKRMAAGVLFRDEDGRVLLVDPTYKPTWDLPGGAVEKEESPHAACRREVTEELGLDRPPGRVLVRKWDLSWARGSCRRRGASPALVRWG